MVPDKKQAAKPVFYFKSDVSDLKAGQAKLEADVKELKSDVKEIKSDVKELKLNVAYIWEDISRQDKRIDRIVR